MRIGTVVDAKDLDSAVAGVKAAADEGFASAWFTQMFSFDAVTVCTVAGREVPGIELGTAVVPTFPRHPVALAMQAVTASLASGGRFALGIGLSHQMVIEGMLGMSYEKPARHMREYLEVLVPLLREGKVDHDGDVYKVHAPVDSMGAPPPPVLVAALGPAMLRVTGELADGTITWMTGPKTLADHIVPSLTKAAGGRDVRVVAALRTCVTDDPDDARERTGQAIAFYGHLPSYRAMLDREGAAEPKDVSIIGDEEHVAATVRGLADIGVTDFVAVPAGTPEELARTRKLLTSL
ncbi:MAG: Coenzyme F420-dependent N10-methylene tetrahydromethanopterin reductase-like protein [Actinomycetia bacterium]|nr:Coenzyme F420-dependent N10-methylene tetrahydromethanopterin reductase-like protein [Actinomycetes bacterium]